MAKARGNQNAPQTSYTRPRRPPNPMMDARYWTTTPPPGYRPQRVPPTAPAPAPSGFFGGLGNRMDQTVQGIGQMFGARPPQQDPSQEWITDTRPRPSMDQLPGGEYDPGFDMEGRERHTLDRLDQPWGVPGRGRHTLDRLDQPGGVPPRADFLYGQDEGGGLMQMPSRRGSPPGNMMSNPMSPGRNGPSSIQGVNLRTGQTQSVPISDRQASTFNDPYVGGRPSPDGSVAPVSNPPGGGGLFTMNPNNVPRSPENIQRRQDIANGVGGLFTMNPNNVPRSPQSVQRRQGIADFFGAQQMESPYDQYPSLPPAGFSNGATMEGGTEQGPRRMPNDVSGHGRWPDPMQSQGTASPDQIYGASNPPLGSSAWPNMRWREQPNTGQSVNPRPTGRVPMSPLARNAQPQGNPFMDEQEAAVADQGLIDRLDAQTRQMQAANPSVPGSPGVSPYAAQDEAMRLQEVQGRRTGQFLDDNPMAGSSTDARRMNRSIPGDIYNQQTAGASNRYEGNVAYANDPYRYSPMDPRIQALQRRNAEDQTAGRSVYRDDRWSSGALDEYTASGGKPWYEREAEAAANSPEVLAKREQAYQNAMAQERPEAKLAKYNEREARIRELEGNRRLSMPPGEYDKLRAKQVDFAAKKAAEHEAFKAANGGMNYAQARREKKQISREDGRFKRDVRRGMNPMSPGAFAAHPEAGARFRNAYAQAGKGASNAQNPMRAASEAFRPNGVSTADSKVKSQGFLDTLGNGGNDPSGNPVPASPFFAGLAEEQDNIQSLHFGIQEQVQSGTEPSDDDLMNLHAAAVAMQSGYGTDSYDPFDMTHGFEGLSGVDAAHTETFTPMYQDLAGMKSPTMGKLKEWWTNFKGRINLEIAAGGEHVPGSSESVGGYEYPRPEPTNPMGGGR